MCIYIYIHIRICAYKYIYIYIHTYMYAYIHVCVWCDDCWQFPNQVVACFYALAKIQSPDEKNG